MSAMSERREVATKPSWVASCRAMKREFFHASKYSSSWGSSPDRREGVGRGRLERLGVRVEALRLALELGGGSGEDVRVRQARPKSTFAFAVHVAVHALGEESGSSDRAPSRGRKRSPGASVFRRSRGRAERVRVSGSLASAPASMSTSNCARRGTPRRCPPSPRRRGWLRRRPASPRRGSAGRPPVGLEHRGVVEVRLLGQRVVLVGQLAHLRRLFGEVVEWSVRYV